MNEYKPSGIQKFLKAIFPASWGASMEAESRQWTIRCPNCNFERSVWETGGIRWKAAGSSKQRGTCSNCRQPGWHTIYKKENLLSGEII